ncbi:hypothetical protein BGZ90_001068 [Linnemannia elongata]|nr:hypothetical protein BGZ90_001068 [Linnemannia elongata]
MSAHSGRALAQGLTTFARTNASSFVSKSILAATRPQAANRLLSTTSAVGQFPKDELQAHPNHISHPPSSSQDNNAPGAEVIKVENPNGGDDTRAWGPPFTCNQHNLTERGESAYFLSVNRNKKSITINFRTKEGQGIIHDLVKKCDILVENYVPGKLEKYGLGYEQVKKLNPKLIYASITGYGQTGPYANRPGYDCIIEAEAGLMHITGESTGPPVIVGVAVTDLTTGLYAHGAIMAALLARAKTGRGQHIDCSLLESQIATLSDIGSSYLISGQEPRRWGASHPMIVPYQAFPTRDSRIMISGGNDGQFKTLCRILGLEHLPTDIRFRSNSDRVKHRDELIKIMTEKLQEHDIG